VLLISSVKLGLKIKPKFYFYSKIISLRNISVASSPREIESHYFEDISDAHIVFPIGFCWGKIIHSRSVDGSVLVRNVTDNSFYTYNFSKVQVSEPRNP